MKPAVYIATRLENAANARLLAGFVEGLNWSVTYQWWEHGSVQRDGFERMREVARDELEGVLDAHVLIVLLPGGRGTHVELGAALGLGAASHYLIHAFDDDALHTGDGTHCAFYYHPAVELIVGDWGVLLARLMDIHEKW